MNKAYQLIIGLVVALSISSCDEFLDTGSPVTQVGQNEVFKDDVGVKAAVAGIFSQMVTSTGFASGNLSSVTVVGSLLSDDMQNYTTSSDLTGLYTNNVAPNSSTVQSNWSDMYMVIYNCNSLLEGLSNANNDVTPDTRKWGQAQAKFVRAFAYFYLVNLFGDVPLITSTDYLKNRLASRTPKDEVYNFILADLTAAQEDLPKDYFQYSGERVYPTSQAASCLLARAYLYLGRWAEAEQQSSIVLNDSKFSLTSLSSSFLANSNEAIWQLRPVNPALNTNEGGLFILTSTPTNVGLTSGLISSFDPADGRLSAWVRTYTSPTSKKYPYAFKYKVRLRNQPITEYYMVLRLAEQYLIRAEARVKQDKLSEGVDDLNKIRQRAGLGLFNASLMTKDEILLAIENERRYEFFAEWGHRWFDLKRTGRATAILGPLKTDWQEKDLLLPIPQAEIAVNVNLTQNP